MTRSDERMMQMHWFTNRLFEFLSLEVVRQHHDAQQNKGAHRGREKVESRHTENFNCPILLFHGTLKLSADYADKLSFVLFCQSV